MRPRLQGRLPRITALLTALLLVTAAALGSSAGGDVEVVSPDEVAAADLLAEGTDAAPGAMLPPGAPSERDELARFGEQFLALWGSIPLYSPVAAASRLTSPFGWRRSPVSGRREFHGGVDLAAPRGTPIVAPGGGSVARVLTDEGSGRVVVVAHGHGIESLYAHLDEVLVVEGQEVARGQPLGRVGSTGWRSTGPHLHYGIRVAGKYVNPGRYLFARAARSRP